MTLPTILPTQGPDPYTFSKINIGEKIGQGIKRIAKVIPNRAPAAAPEAPKEQLAIEYKPMLALPPGKPAAPEPKPKYVRHAGRTLPNGVTVMTNARRVVVPRQLPISAAQQKANAVRGSALARRAGTPKPHWNQKAIDKRNEFNNKYILKGKPTIGSTIENPGSDLIAAARFSGRRVDPGGTPYNPGARTASNDSANRVVRTPSGKPVSKPGAKPAVKPGSKPVQGGRPAPRNGRTR
jgi:hypothetical protein